MSVKIDGETYYSSDEIVKCLLIAIAGIAFMYSEGPIWSLGFVRTFGSNMILYSAWVALIFIAIFSVTAKSGK
jgi:hypothetical protein